MKHVLGLALAFASVTSAAQTPPSGVPPRPRATAAEVPPDTPFKPYRIADGFYYVGTKGLAVYLLTTPKGHVLINGTYPSSVPLVLDNIRTLGFQPADVRYILQSHAHPDHASGNAALKEATGATVFIMDDDVGVIRSGGRDDFQYPEQEIYPPGPVDVMLHDGDIVRLGALELQALKTPGHTKGCTTWHFKVEDHGQPRDVVILCSINFNPGYKLVNNRRWPDIADGFRHTYQVSETLRPDIWLAPHPFMFDMDRKVAAIDKGANPFVDPTGYRQYVALQKANFEKELQRQEGEASAK